ncbi:MAG: hypothetical protein LBQ24_03140 [Candidatus Peribacteria bacterium]|nr:hypothetical protein [Candidatus Peribacteria bacterium]
MFQLESSSKFPAFACSIINFTSFQNLGQIFLPFGLQIFLASLSQETTKISFTFNSSFMISS